jgi:hypothetical protein
MNDKLWVGNNICHKTYLNSFNIKKPCSNHRNMAFFVNCGFKENQKYETYA